MLQQCKVKMSMTQLPELTLFIVSLTCISHFHLIISSKQIKLQISDWRHFEKKFGKFSLKCRQSEICSLIRLEIMTK